MSKQTPEGKVKDMVKARLKEAGAYQFWPVQTGMGAATVDCLACVPLKITSEMVGATIGIFAAIETKRGDTRPEPTPRQTQVLREVAEARGSSHVVFDERDMARVLRR